MRRGIKIWIVERENYGGGNYLPHVSLDYGQRVIMMGRISFGRSGVVAQSAALAQLSSSHQSNLGRVLTKPAQSTAKLSMGAAVATVSLGAALLAAIQGARHAANAAVASARTHPR